MKKKQLNKLNYYSSIIDVMEKNLEVWQGLPAMSNSYDRFVRNYKKMIDLKQATPGNLQVFINDYTSRRSVLVQQLVPFLNAAAVIGYDSKNAKLEKLAGIKQDKLEKLKDDDLVGLIRKVMKYVNLSSKKSKKGGKLSLAVDYGISEDQIGMITNMKDEMIAAATSIRSAEEAKQKNQQKVKKLIQANNTLLARKLDRLVATFQYSHADFHEAYKNARENTSAIVEGDSKEASNASKSKQAAPKKTASQTSGTPKKSTPVKKAAGAKTTPASRSGAGAGTTGARKTSSTGTTRKRAPGSGSGGSSESK